MSPRLFSPHDTNTDRMNTFRFSESDAFFTLKDTGLNFDSIKDDKQRKRVQRAMERHCDNVTEWASTVDKCQERRTKRKTGANKLLGPKRTLLELQNEYKESVIPQDIKEQVYSRFQKFESKYLKHYPQTSIQQDPNLLTLRTNLPYESIDVGSETNVNRHV